ncbi:ABC transporter substrate-binding protein [Ferviditalea candida]|uniref:ABC transporter substrate-binding protein n=1 Tax=Ferviditalea candida TaxID=3108399 RepID=A0ABU5ZIM3_9BACL|nr:ABC transporter substrate-binding protein [Paenibacillaceae bacterium T2]
MIQLGTKGAGTPSKGPVPQGLRPSDPGLKNYEYNIEKAKELFKQAGVDPKGLKLELTHAAENEVEKRFAPLLKESFAQLGIDLEVKPILWNQQWQLAKGDPKKAQDIFVLLWWPSFSDGYDNLKGMFHSEDAPSFNLAYWYNKDFDKLIDDAYALSGTDKAKSKELYHQAQQMLIDEAPAMYFFDAKKNLPMNANLEGEGTNPNYANVIFFNRLKTK